MKNKSIHLPALLLLFPLFFVLHGYNSFFGLVPVYTVLLQFVKFCFIALAIFFLSTLLLKDYRKAFFYSLALMLFYLFFGKIHDELNQWKDESFFSSYIFLLTIILLLTIVLMLWLRKKRDTSLKALNYATLLLILLVAIEVLTFSYKLISRAGEQNSLAVELPYRSAPSILKPDIYFIVYDELASEASLAKLGVDSSVITKFNALIENAGFTIYPHALVNYNYTTLSLSSLLAGSMLQANLEDTLNLKLLLCSIQTMKEIHLPRFLDSVGYDVHNYGWFDLKDHPTPTGNYFGYDYYASVIGGQTLDSRIERDLSWNWTMGRGEEVKVPSSFLSRRSEYLDRDSLNLTLLLHRLRTRTDKPQFVFTHFMHPHKPYYRMGDGSLRDAKELVSNNFDPVEGYRQQVLFTFQEAASVAESIEQLAERPAVFVILGDHGYRNQDRSKDSLAPFRSFLAVKTVGLPPPPDSLQPIQLMPWILNTFLGQQRPVPVGRQVFIK